MKRRASRVLLCALALGFVACGLSPIETLPSEREADGGPVGAGGSGNGTGGAPVLGSGTGGAAEAPNEMGGAGGEAGGMGGVIK